MLWWYWLLLGLLLIGLEMASAGGFYVIFFGAAAVIVAPLVALGIAGPAWMQWLLFSVLSVVSLLLFRNPVMRRMNLNVGAADIDTLAGEAGSALTDIAAGATGHVELRGATWTARNAGPTPLSKGDRCVVVKAERLTLLVRAEGTA